MLCCAIYASLAASICLELVPGWRATEKRRVCRAREVLFLCPRARDSVALRYGRLLRKRVRAPYGSDSLDIR